MRQELSVVHLGHSGFRETVGNVATGEALQLGPERREFDKKAKSDDTTGQLNVFDKRRKDSKVERD